MTICLLASHSGSAYAGIFPVTTTAESGSGSLRLAILGANASAGLDTISFNISGSGPHTIKPGNPLPFITDALLIDGSTEPDFAGAPVIELDGVLSGPNSGLVLAARNVTLRALAINRFGASGVEVRLDSCIIEGCYIGTDLSGTATRENAGNGIAIFGSDNRVGGFSAEARNLISGNVGRGILVTVPAQVPNRIVQRNLIVGNYIGTDLSGTARLPNQLAGIVILDASNNVVGGATAGSKNLISGNNSDGILVRGVKNTASGNVILGNFIGTNASGAAPLRNGRDGILVSDAANNTIGDTLTAGRNLISGNAQYGVYILGPKATGNRVLGNIVGADSSGAAAMGNGLSGIAIRDASGNRVGGPQPGARNLISGNGVFGVLIGLAAPGVAAQDTIQGNFIGTDMTGAAPLPNGDSGVLIEGASQTFVNSNLISGNTLQGILIDGTLHPASKTENNVVSGNLIGTDAPGMSALANGFDGVKIVRASANQIGGIAITDRNVISGNGDHAIEISSFGASSANNVIQGNFLGLNGTGAALLPNASLGIFIVDSGASGAIIGGSVPGSGNVISGHQVNIALSSGNNTVQGNRIGTDAAGNGLAGVDSIGVWVINVSNNSIGGANASEGNLISGQKEAGILLINGSSDNLIGSNVLRDNDGDGVRVSQNGVRNTMLKNTIFNNGALGIELGEDGVTANDPGDGDAGPNNLQNFPTLTLAVDNGDLTVAGELKSSATSQFTAEFFYNTNCDPSGNGEGETFLGTTVLNTDASGKAVFSVDFQGVSFSSGFVAATATDASGNTSEFGNCVEIGAVPAAPQLVAPADSAAGLGTMLTLRWRSASGTTRYHLQVSKDSLFSEIAFEDSSSAADTSVVVSGLADFTTYFWRVRARNAVGWGLYSSIRRFSVGSAPQAPVLLEPANGATALSESVTFRWAAVASAGSYRLQVATDSNFSALVFEAAGLPDTSETVVNFMQNTLYYWRVRAMNQLGSGPFSTVRSFATGALLPAPVLVAPVDGAKDLPEDVTFLWRVVAGADTYHFQLATDAGLDTLIFEDSSLTDTSAVVKALEKGATYFWRVRAGNQIGWGGYSAARKFSIENITSVEPNGIIPAAFTLEQNYPNPFNPQTTIGYSLPTATYVQLEVFDVLGRRVAVLVREQQQAGHQQVVFDATNLANGVYVYRIRAGLFVREYKMLLLK